MEPALDERGDLDGERMRVDDIAGPQWSPLSTSGATSGPESCACARVVAAMEPALDERGDLLADFSVTANGVAPQWSPLSTSGATGQRRPPLHPHRDAAMEPALDERGDPPRPPRRLPHRRPAAMEPALDERGDRGKPAKPARGAPAFRVIRGFWRRDRGITAGRKAGSLRQARKRLEKRLPILSLAREVVDGYRLETCM